MKSLFSHPATKWDVDVFNVLMSAYRAEDEFWRLPIVDALGVACSQADTGTLTSLFNELSTKEAFGSTL